MKTKKQQFHKRFIGLFCALLLLFSAVIGGQGLLSAFAADRTQHSTVLEDLQLDENFDADMYPFDDTDYSVYVIQVAESTEGDLFIYTYQPAQLAKYYVASFINLCLTKRMTNSDLYALELISAEGVLCKYRVKDFTVSEDVVRYYYITSIYRNWIRGIDKQPAGDGKTEDTAFAVAQLWTATTEEDGSVTYGCEDVDYIELTEQYTNRFRYDSSFEWGGHKRCDAHFFVFNTEREIDYLLSADITFVTIDYKIDYNKKITWDEASEPITITVDSTMEGHNKKNSWQRLCSVEEFLQTHDVPKAEAEKLESFQWMINFLETDYTTKDGWQSILEAVFIPFGGGVVWAVLDSMTGEGTLCESVSLLRLEYSYQGRIYNVGVVSDRTSQPFDPMKGDKGINIPWWVWIIVAVAAPLVILLVLSILAGFFPLLTPFVQSAWRVYGQVLKWTILLPFWGIPSLIKKAKEKKEGG